MDCPRGMVGLMKRIYKKILPAVKEELSYWKGKAEAIPDPELRKQALASIRDKAFHCVGGAIFSLLSGKNYRESLRFITAFQTMSDYLDNLCDRSNSLDAEDFAALHESMEDAITIGRTPGDYYRFRREKEDGGYLAGLVQVCQQVLSGCASYSKIFPGMRDLCQYYCALQIHKHVPRKERVGRLMAWHRKFGRNYPELAWYEFSAAAGSTLGIFCLVSYGMNPCQAGNLDQIQKGYFPYIQGLHILLDYLIDQKEDEAGGDLNFCHFFPNEKTLLERFKYFYRQADEKAKTLPDPRFHQFINRGLLALYLSDDKASNKKIRPAARTLLRLGGLPAHFFYWNAKYLRRKQKISGAEPG
jgi:Protein of unknown function (DUF2600).